MNASIHPFSVADLALSQVAVVSQQTGSGLPRWMRFLALPFGTLFARNIHKNAKTIATMGVWFQGAVAIVASESVENVIDKDGALVQALEGLESKLLHLRGQVLDVVRNLEEIDGKRRGAVRDALRMVVQASSDAFEAVQTFRWAVLEHDSDADIAGGRTSGSFSDVEDLIASLKS